MDEYDDLDTYKGNPVHDGWVDFDYNENTGELSDIFDESNLDQYIDNHYCAVKILDLEINRVDHHPLGR